MLKKLSYNGSLKFKDSLTLLLSMNGLLMIKNSMKEPIGNLRLFRVQHCPHELPIDSLRVVRQETSQDLLLNDAIVNHKGWSELMEVRDDSKHCLLPN